MLPLFVAICEIWLPGLTYDVYLVLFLKPGATLSGQQHQREIHTTTINVTLNEELNEMHLKSHNARIRKLIKYVRQQTKLIF